MRNSRWADVVGGTEAYLAPEVVETRKGSFKSDVYSFGICMWHVLTGKTPWFEFDDDIKKLAADGLRPTIPEDCTVDWYTDLIKVFDYLLPCYYFMLIF